MEKQKLEQFVRLRDQLRQLGVSDLIDQCLASCILTKDQQFRLRSFWFNRGERKNFDLLYYKVDGNPVFELEHMRVAIRRNIPIPPLKVNGVDTRELEKRMLSVDWVRSNPSADCTLEFRGKSAFFSYLQDIYADLQRLGITEDGTKAQLLLQAKYLSMAQEFGDTLQQKLNQVDAAYTQELIVPVRGHQPPTMEGAFRQLITGDEQARQLSAAHQLFFTSSYKIAVMGPTPQQPITLTENIRFFSTFEKAFAFATDCDLEMAASVNTQMKAENVPIGKLVINDCHDNGIIADKTCFPFPRLPADRKVAGWRVDTSKMPGHEFERKTGVPLSHVELVSEQLGKKNNQMGPQKPSQNSQNVNRTNSRKGPPGHGHGR